MILGFEPHNLVIFIVIALLICVTLCTLAMEASMLFTPAFLFLFPVLFAEFPKVTANEAIGLAITIEFFGYTSSVLGYWYRKQIDFRLAGKVLVYTVPLAVVGRVAAYFVPGDGLLVLFSLVLVGLAIVIFRAHQGEFRHTCLLCGDSRVAMHYEADNPHMPGDGGDAEAPPVSTPEPTPDSGIIRTAFNVMDRFIVCIAGAFAGIVGVGIGEISNTFLTVRKRVPVKVSTGTSALVLHITILAALAANLVILWSDLPVFDAKGIEIPWLIAFICAPVVIIGGQIGAYINSKITDRTLIRALMTAYVVIGVFVLARVTA